MKMKPNPILQWNRLKKSVKNLAALAIFGGVASVTHAQITFTPVFSNAWVVTAGSYAGMTASGDNWRGIAINPVTTNVLFSSRSGGTNGTANNVNTLSFSSGSNFLGQLSSSGITGGTIQMEQVRVADDGTVYACSLSGAPASALKIYKWASDSDFVTAPAVVFNNSGASFQWRTGDYMDLRGSGTNTEMVFSGTTTSGAQVCTNLVFLRPTDSTCTTFTNFTIFVPGGAAAVNIMGNGIAFEGTNNAVWVRRGGGGTAGQETRRVSYNPATLTATVTATNNVDQSACAGLKYFSVNGLQMLATVEAGSHKARVFTIPASPTAQLVSVLSSNLPAPVAANANGIGAVDFKNGFIAFGEVNNAMMFFQLGFVTNSPPSSVNISSAGGTFIGGYGLNATLTGTSAGSTPLKYQWYFASATATNPILAGTTNIYTVTNVVTTNAGNYFFVVTNAFGTATSSVASLTVLPNGASSFASPLWSLAPGSRPYLTGAGTDLQRGLGYDANSNRVVVVSRVSHTNLNDLVTVEPYGAILLDANTGAEAGELDMSALWSLTPAGTFPVSMCGVADDGVVYIANLITSANSDTFAIYSWPAADGLVSMNGTPAYYANPMGLAYPGAGGNGRIGDSMAVRGAGTNTQILCPFRNGTNICIFTTADGFNFDAHVVAVTNLSASAGLTDPFSGASPLGLGCAFGSGNTFWAKSSTYNLRQVSFNLDDNTAAVIGSYPINGTAAPLGVNNVGGYIGIIGHNELPMNLALYNINDPAQLTTANISDRELFGLGTNSVANGNGTGAVAFDTTRARAFALSSNNGILALKVNPATGAAVAVPGGGTVTWSGPGILQSATDVSGPYTDVTGAFSPYTNTGASRLFFRIKR
jgi:hypothetical protein